MKKLLLLSACLLALGSSPVLAQTSAPDMVVVKVTEGFGSLYFDIARAGSKPEHRDVGGLKQLKELGGGQYMGGQAEYTRSLLVELAQQGYTLTTTYTATASTGGSGPTTLIFTKRP